MVWVSGRATIAQGGMFPLSSFRRAIVFLLLCITCMIILLQVSIVANS